eukprot:scaffold76107_cov18-Tisochrysis_lutea.AAC.1
MTQVVGYFAWQWAVWEFFGGQSLKSLCLSAIQLGTGMAICEAFLCRGRGLIHSLEAVCYFRVLVRCSHTASNVITKRDKRKSYASGKHPKRCV